MSVAEVSWKHARTLAGHADPMPAVTVRLDSALGAAVAGDLRAPASLPAADTAAMDGFATRGTGPWRVTGKLLAGQVCPTAIRDGEAVEIATGAAVPAGTGAVVRYEDVNRSGHGTISGPAQPRGDIRPAGSDFRAGQILVPAGTRLTALMIGLAASAGCDQLRVHPRPRAAVVVTGSEMRTSGLPSATVTRDALGPAMTGLINSLGADVTQVSYTGDNEEALAHVLAGSVADVLVVTGGSSAGPADQLHKVLADAGAVLVVDGVRCRPGRPQVLARLRDGRRVVGLPGNPFAAVAGLITLLAPLLSAWSGEAAATENVVPCPEGVPRRRGYTILAPVRLDEAGEPHLLPRTSSASLLSVAQASHLLAAADGDTAVLVTLPTGLPR